MSKKEVLTPGDVSKRWKGYKETKTQLLQMLADGWEIRQGSGYAEIFCPCEDEHASLPVFNTPKTDSVHARRIKRLASHCPDRHELLNRDRQADTKKAEAKHAPDNPSSADPGGSSPPA